MRVTHPTVRVGSQDPAVLTTAAKYEYVCAFRSGTEQPAGNVVEVAQSTISGEGLFTTCDVQCGQMLYTERMEFAHAAVLPLRDGTMLVLQNASCAWPLVLKLAREGKPTWWSSLATQTDFRDSELALRGNNVAMRIVLKELGGLEKVKLVDLKELFGQVLTNYVLGGPITVDSTEAEIVACGRLYSKMNHSRTPNAETVLKFGSTADSLLELISGEGELHLECYAKLDMPARTEVTIDYLKAAEERGLTN